MNRRDENFNIKNKLHYKSEIHSLQCRCDAFHLTYSYPENSELDCCHQVDTITENTQTLTDVQHRQEFIHDHQTLKTNSGELHKFCSQKMKPESKHCIMVFNNLITRRFRSGLPYASTMHTVAA